MVPPFLISYSALTFVSLHLPPPPPPPPPERMLQVHAMAGMVLELRVGVVRVEVGGFHRDCLSYPRAVLSELECRLPQLAHGRVDDLVGKIKVPTTMCFGMALSCV